MKTFSAGLAAAYASGSTTLCSCLRVLRSDSVVALFTSADVNVNIGGETYLSASGLDVSNLVSQASLAVDNMDLTVLRNENSYPEVDILAGRWDFAKFWLFECDYADTSLASGTAIGALDSDGLPLTRNDVNMLKRGTTGEADPLRSSLKFEFRGLKQALQQNVGAVTSPTCRYKLGSTTLPDGLCMVDLTSFTHTDTLTAVNGGAPNRIFTCSADLNVDDYYGEGSCLSLDGANAGYERKIKSFAASVFTLAIEMPFAFGIGDTVTVIAGCRLRFEEDCITKFANPLNFGGEPHVPGADLLTADPTVG